MRNRSLILILCLAGSLLGCSSKPSTGDIATGVNEFWKGCAKIPDVTKTNGVENGNTYRVSFTYKLEVLEEGGSGPIGKPSSCSLEQSMALMKIAMSSGVDFAPGMGSPIKKGDVFTVTNETNMVKSEKGWIFQ